MQNLDKIFLYKYIVISRRFLGKFQYYVYVYPDNSVWPYRVSNPRPPTLEVDALPLHHWDGRATRTDPDQRASPRSQIRIFYFSSNINVHVTLNSTKNVYDQRTDNTNM